MVERKVSYNEFPAIRPIFHFSCDLITSFETQYEGPAHPHHESAFDFLRTRLMG